MFTQKNILGLSLLLISILTGCEALRFAPGEAQKQNAWLHKRTVDLSAQQARQEQTSPVLQQLTQQASRQSDALATYFGPPEKFPAADTPQEALSSDNSAITQAALAQSAQRPNPWDLADQILQLGIGLAGILGGVYGTRILAALRTTREKSLAIREIIQGNELFKRQNPESTEAFKLAQAAQSASTRQWVAGLK